MNKPKIQPINSYHNGDILLRYGDGRVYWIPKDVSDSLDRLARLEDALDILKHGGYLL